MIRQETFKSFADAPAVLTLEETAKRHFACERYAEYTERLRQMCKSKSKVDVSIIEYEQRRYSLMIYRTKPRERKEYHLTCRNCGKKFISSYTQTAYCSSECRRNKPEELKQGKIQRRFVFVGDTSHICPNPKCNWRLDCGGNKSVCLRAKCNHGIVFT